MRIETLVVGSFQCNCFILVDEKSLEAIIVDPGDEPEAILSYVTGEGLTVKALIHTHAHLDHMMATKKVQSETNALAYLHKEDTYLWENVQMQADMFGLETDGPGRVDKHLEEGMEINWGGEKVKTIFTPGHTPGSCCFHYAGSESLLFSGDTLFKNSIGRTDLWGGDFEKISKSIRKKLYSLDDDTVVLCGHGPETLIGKEKRYNPFVTL